jgi:hypothetical protein
VEGQQASTTKLENPQGVQRIKLNQYLCPENLDTNGLIGGQPYDNQYNFTSLIISKCKNSTTSNVVCKS